MLFREIESIMKVEQPLIWISTQLVERTELEGSMYRKV